MYPVKLKAIPVKRIWGGHKFKDQFGVQVKDPVGEYWLISGHPTAPSVVENGVLKGKTLIELTEEYPEEFLGRSPQPRFPLLIKILEAEQDLSVQVHPDDAYAKANENDFGKTEAWYILDCPSDGKVNYGHRFQSRNEYIEAVKEKRVKSYLTYQPIKPGDAIYVPAGTLHALLAGTMVLEVQQTSDVTYRVYDWDRVDDRGKGRELHVDKAGDVLNYAVPTDSTGTLEEKTWVKNESVVQERLLASPYFTLDRFTMTGTNAVRVNAGKLGNPDSWIILEGHGELIYGEEERLSLQAGDAVLVPSSLKSVKFTTNTGLMALRAFY